MFSLAPEKVPYPLLREYTLNDARIPSMIQGKFRIKGYWTCYVFVRQPVRSYEADAAVAHVLHMRYIVKILSIPLNIPDYTPLYNPLYIQPLYGV